MASKLFQRISGGGASPLVLGVLAPAPRGRPLRRRRSIHWRAGGRPAGAKLRRRSLLAGNGGGSGVSRAEDEDGGKPEQSRGGEDDHGARGQWVERAIEQEAEPVAHRTLPALGASTPGGWA